MRKDEEDDNLVPGDDGDPQVPASHSGAEEPLVEVLSAVPLPRRAERSAGPSAESAQRLSQAVFFIQNGDGRSMTFNVSGRSSPVGRRITGWQVDFGALNVQMNDLGRFIAAYHERGDALGRSAWLHAAQQIGWQLYGGLLRVDGLLAQRLLGMRYSVQPRERLTLAFAGPRAYLSVPYELLHDGRAPLAVEHPLCRQVSEWQQRTASFAGVMERLCQQEQALRILLIAADGPEGVTEAEVSAIYRVLARRAAALEVPLAVEVLAGADLRLDAVRLHLTQCPYHIVHFAGHIHHNRYHPGQGGLLFADRRLAGYALLTLDELVMLLQHSSTALFTVSASIGPAEWGVPVLRDQDYLDVLVAPLRAGVPYTLGLRWVIAQASKRVLVTRYYDALLSDPFVPELALQHARRAIYERDPRDEAWASPVLIAQSVYGTEEEPL